MVKAGFGLTPAVEILANVPVENAASARVLEKCGFAIMSTGLQGAPARGGLVECHSFRLTRKAWAEASALRRQTLAEQARLQTDGRL